MRAVLGSGMWAGVRASLVLAMLVPASLLQAVEESSRFGLAIPPRDPHASRLVAPQRPLPASSTPRENVIRSHGEVLTRRHWVVIGVLGDWEG